MSHEVESMFSVRETPWHGLGTIIQEAVSSAEAITLAGLDWTVDQVPLIYKNQDSGYMINVRSSDEKVLGVVGGRYKPVQNTEAFNFMDVLLGQDVRYETAGSLATGKRIWMLAKMPQTTILGDAVEPFMVLTNSHDGFGSLKVCMTPVRVVCQNTLNMALDGAKRTWNVRHTGSISAKMTAAQQTLGLASQYVAELDKTATLLTKVKISNLDFQTLANQMFPIADDMTARKQDSQAMLQAQLKNAWEVDDLGNIRGTGWGFINAVSDMATHKPALRETDNGHENAFMAVLDAPLLLDLATKLVMARVA